MLRAACAAAALLACLAAPVAGAPAKPPKLHPLHAEPDPEAGGRIVDSKGREVLLRGVNVNAFAEYWQGTPLPTVFPLDSKDPRRMAKIGWNAVRLLVSWSRVEPEPGRYDAAYLKRVSRAMDSLRREGIYTILDLHQDAWGASLAARQGEVCPPPSEPARGWDGAPAWATLDQGQPRCFTEFREASPAVYRSWQAFWADEAGPGGVGIQTRYVAMLRHLAQRFATKPGLAGFDLMNEPNAFGEQDEIRLSAMYTRALREIRAGERAGRGAPHLVLFEPSALWSAIGSGAPPDFERDRDVVYAPHVYTGGFDNGPITREAFQTARDEAAGFGGAPVLSGEWGSGPRRANDSGDPYFTDHQRLQDDFRFSATLWTWRESCGDPHVGGEGSPWGEFEVSCPSNRVAGMRTALVDQLTRAYVRAGPGRIRRASYDHRTGLFEAEGTAPAGRESDLLVFYPAGRWRGMRVNVRGLSPPSSARVSGGARLVTARSHGGSWAITIRAPKRR
jgi:endoglycosylceramidase